MGAPHRARAAEPLSARWPREGCVHEANGASREGRERHEADRWAEGGCVAGGGPGVCLGAAELGAELELQAGDR